MIKPCYIPLLVQFLTFLLFPAAAQSSDAGLSAWWKCDEGAGIILEDAGPSSVHGQLPSPDMWSSDSAGSFLRFPANGKSVVEIPFQENSDFGQSDFSISFWYAAPLFRPGNFRLLGSLGSSKNGWHINILNGRPNLEISFMPAGAQEPVAITSQAFTDLPEEHWCQIVMSADRKSGKTTFYIDGAIEGEYPIDPRMTGSIWPDSSGIRIGAEGDARPTGRLADIKLWKSAVTAAEVAADYNAYSRKEMATDPGRPVQARVAPVFSDHMVLQRAMAVPIFGSAPDDSEITVAFAEQHKTTRAKNGHWQVNLSPLKASNKGGDLGVTINNKQTGAINKTTFCDVLVGEVWIASGQSNMVMPLAEAEQSLAPDTPRAQADLPTIRFYPMEATTQPRNPYRSKWVPCTPESSANFSAVAFYFARDLNQATDIPVGIIGSYWGGTRVDTWMNPESFSENPAFAELAKMRAEGRSVGTHRYEIPGTLYLSLIRPWIPYAIRGAIWYQGESNAFDPKGYKVLLESMIADWRRQWGEGDFPFYLVQLPKFRHHGPEIRDVQWALTQEVPNTGLAVAVDTGDLDNIHPCDKEPVGVRLSLLARANVHHQKIESMGPMYKSMQVKASDLILSFDHVGKGLKALNQKLPEFEIVGDDRNFTTATARIDGKCVVLNSPLAPHPKAARYAWKAMPEKSLGNTDGLPAGPFSTETYVPPKPSQKKNGWLGFIRLPNSTR